MYGISPSSSNDFKVVVVVWYSGNGGVNWSAPTLVESCDHARHFNDKEFAVAGNPASLHFSRVYLSRTDFRWEHNNQAEPAMFAASKDGGITCGTAQQFSNASNSAGPGNGHQDTVIASGLDGGVCAAWADTAIDAFYLQKPAFGRGPSPLKATSQSSDLAGSAQGNLSRQFWGDDRIIRSGVETTWFACTRGRNGAGYPVVDVDAPDGAGPE